MEREKAKDVLSEEQKSALCLECGGKCCRELPISLAYDPDSEMFKKISSFFMQHGCRAVIIQKTLVMKVPHVCQHLLPDSKCAIYENRPVMCRDYDGRKDPTLFKECLWNRQEDGTMKSSAGYSDKATVQMV